MAEQRESAEPEVATHRFEIARESLRIERGGIGYERRSSRTALVVEEKHVPLGERTQVVREVARAEPRAAVEHDDRVAAGADHPIEQPHAIGGIDVPLTDRLRDLAGARAWRSGPHACGAEE